MPLDTVLERIFHHRSLLEGGANGIDDTATQFAELWQLLFVDRPFTIDGDSPDSETRVPRGGLGGLSGLGGLASGGTGPEAAVDQTVLLLSKGVAGSPPLSWTGMLHSNPGDYAWGQGGLDAVITQLLGQFENTGPPPAEKEKISSLPIVHISQDQADCSMECPVCKDDFSVGEPVRQLPCNHFFHSDCIVPWLEMVRALGTTFAGSWQRAIVCDVIN
ncbi:hypothetical protein NHX12_001430 [Muraenolepis orangiensis]|uniref:RING-type E3 ubiquitin transferase n=1 Tax=Muraenolepis orangiensis TaxID=630683 RepID=A0A9Q0E0Q0_9TELE|nr:hypothetical protein NHX12_001430 [Muraenolepis orangiensis]